MYAEPGKKLLFMGGEFAQWHEWSHDHALDWPTLHDDKHARVSLLIGDLNRLYRSEPALGSHDAESFQWLAADDHAQSILAFMRRDAEAPIVAVFNFTPVPRENYRVGVPSLGVWHEILNSDAQSYGGSGHGNFGGVEAQPIALHGQAQSLNLTVPPLGAIFLKR
jgi:1,4-alpha-glucan branching enzyme